MAESDEVWDVSVIVPVYNGQSLLWKALDSVCLPAIANAEIIVLDDGSTDQSWEAIVSYTNQKIRAVKHTNIGLAATLNRGVSLALGRYVARQDQDDLVLEDRINKQINFLDQNPNIAICGSWAQIYVDDIPTDRYHRHPASNEALQLELLFDNPFVHSSMMIRADVLREIGGYSEDKSRQPPEDYELWSRISRKYKVANIPEVLTVYREVAGSMSRTGVNPFLNNVIQISAENLSHILLQRGYSETECLALTELYHKGGEANFRVNLTKSRALAMLDTAAFAIGGEKKNWSTEFLNSYKKMKGQLESRYLRQFVPSSLLGILRYIKRKIKN
jgi:hypothetical protein